MNHQQNDYDNYEEQLINDKQVYLKKHTELKDNLKFIWLESAIDNDQSQDQKKNYIDQNAGKYNYLYNDNYEMLQYDFNYKPFIEITTSELHLKKDPKTLKQIDFQHQCQKEGNNFILLKGQKIYKGVKYFYTPQKERQLFGNHEHQYFGDKYMAYAFSKIYTGGLHVYQAKEDIKLYCINNDKNLLELISKLKQQPKTIKKWKELKQTLQQKFGVGINKYKQALKIYEKSGWNNNEQWMYRPSKQCYNDYNNCQDSSYSGWTIDNGKINRICTQGALDMLNNEFDGIICLQGFYTPYKYGSFTTQEIILLKNDKIERVQDDPLDSYFIMKNNILPFDPQKIDYDEDNKEYWSKNQNFRMILFYQFHQENNLEAVQKYLIKEYDNFKFNKQIQFYKDHADSLLAKNIEIKQGFRILSFNVHDFISIIKTTQQNAIEKLQSLILKYDVDIGCFQEFYCNAFLKIQNYKVIKNMKHKGLVIIFKYKYNVQINDIITLYNEKGLDPHRYGLFFNFNNLLFCTTHLEVGRSIYNKQTNKVLPPNQLVPIVEGNSEIRKKQLKQIINKKPDFIIGDFNFVQSDTEFDFLTENGYFTIPVQYTTPFGTQVDWFFSKEKDYLKHVVQINYAYSDHLPILGIINMNKKMPNKIKSRSKSRSRSLSKEKNKIQYKQQEEEEYSLNSMIQKNYKTYRKR